MKNRALCWSTIVAYALLVAAAPVSAQQPSSADTVAVQGILISPNGRSALIDGQLAREGESVHGARVVEITEMGVVLQSEAAELIVPIGGSASWDTAQPIRRVAARAAPANESEPATARIEEASGRLRTVAVGDTLSEIAADHLTPGTTLDETMRGIFAANRHAFGDDIHHLLAGATLNLPETAAAPPVHSVVPVKPANTLAEADGRPGAVAATGPAATPAAPGSAESYGPVEPGETLSEIAIRMSQPGFTANQTMIAIYQLNPDAFLNNINMLKAGATLLLPDEEHLSRLSRDYATGEVRRQADLWRHGRIPVLAQAR